MLCGTICIAIMGVRYLAFTYDPEYLKSEGVTYEECVIVIETTDYKPAKTEAKRKARYEE